MDPASASVAGVGVAASLTTLTALVVDSSKTLLHISSRWKKAPEDIARLLAQLQLFERLLYETSHHIENAEAACCAPDTVANVAIAVDHMLKDLRDLEKATHKCKALVSRPLSAKKNFVLRVRHVLQEDEVLEYQRRISSHIGTLTLLLELYSR